MPINLENGYFVIAKLIGKSGTVIRAWDMRHPETAILSERMPENFIEAYNNGLPESLGDRITLDTREVLMVFVNGKIAGGVNVYVSGNPKVFRIKNISSTKTVLRTAELILGAALQYIENVPGFVNFVSPISPYFVMECILQTLGAVPIKNSTLLELEDAYADPEDDTEFVTYGIFAGTVINWIPRPYKMTEIIKNCEFDHVQEFVRANRN
jgi:hypothetical protein